MPLPGAAGTAAAPGPLARRHHERRQRIDLEGAAASISFEQLRLLATQASRTLIPLMLADLFLAWLTHSAGQTRLGLIWFIAVTSMQVVRRSYALRLLGNMPPPAALAGAWRRMNGLFLLIGATRALVIPLSFAQPEGSVKYTVTMVLIALAAGGVASVAGNLKPFLMWAVPIFLTLMTAWMLAGDVEGFVFAFLLAVMLAFISAAVRDQQRGLAESMKIREQNRDLLVSLEAERDKARAASEAKTRFFAAASHDLRQPLHALSLHVATLDLIASDARTKRISAQLNLSLTHANALLEGLIDLSRLDANAITPVVKPFALSDTLQAIEGEFALDCEQRGLTLTVTEQPANLWVASDADLLLRIVRNLAGNGLKFTGKGGVTVSASAQDAQHVVLAVSDTGIGIAPAEQERVFEEFYQIGNPGRDRSQGLGLGLSIVRRLCDMLELPLTLTSAPGQGTRFEITLPRTAPTLSTAGPGLERDFSSLPLRVLLVDDEEPVLEAVSAFLTEIGWDCAAAASYEEAERRMHQGFEPDVMVLDVRLGERSGIDLALQLRHEFGGIPVLFVTGESDPEKIEALNQTGFASLTKPVDGPTLVAFISKLVEPEELT